MFPVNTWYVACAADEIDDKPLGRTICKQNIVFYRAQDNKAAALEDFCPHRGAPLSLGRVIEGILIGASAYAAQVSHHFGDGSPGDRLDIAQTLRHAPEGSHLYVCGPQRFIDAALDAARLLDWSQDRLHYEYFSAAPVDTTADGSFELEIASTGQLIPVRADRTALQALLDAGIDVPSSCEQGVCGTCLTGVKSGAPLHRDHYLLPEEQQANDQFMPCCSRASSARLVLDL